MKCDVLAVKPAPALIKGFFDLKDVTDHLTQPEDPQLKSDQSEIKGIRACDASHVEASALERE